MKINILNYDINLQFYYQRIIINDTMTEAKQLKPLQLISFDANKKILVNPQAISWLNSVSQDKHIGVVTVVGKYRTGKSYILNRVLLNRNNGFQVGPTINACTKGLWVWPQLIQNPNNPNTHYMVMDTEGLGSLEEGQQTDTKIFLMAMMLSSYFIYNSMGNIDQKAVQSLSLIINLSKMLQKGDEKERQNIIQCFPSFLWLVRDFALRLVDSNNYPISPKQYLDNALQQQKGNSELASRKNNIRKQLTTFFKDRDCFTLIRPVDDESKLQNMSKIKEEDLRPRFRQLVDELRKKIFHQVKSKTFKGRPCSPAMFIELCQHFCDSINKGGLPEIESNWDLVCKAESGRLEKRCFSDFEKLMQKFESMNPSKIEMKDFEKQTQSKLSQLLKYFQKNVLGDKHEKKRQIKEKMQAKIEELKRKMSREKNKEMDQVFEDLNNKIENQINQNSVDSVFEIAEQFDSIIERQEKTSTVESKAFLYQRSYQGLKSCIYSYFGSIAQSEKFEKNLLSDKLSIYKDSLNRIQNEYSKKNEQADERERQLRQKVFQLQIQAQQSVLKLQKAKKELEEFHK